MFWTGVQGTKRTTPCKRQTSINAYLAIIEAKEQDVEVSQAAGVANAIAAEVLQIYQKCVAKAEVREQCLHRRFLRTKTKVFYNEQSRRLAFLWKAGNIKDCEELVQASGGR